MNIDQMTSRAAEVEHILKALANRNRLIILCELHGKERSVAQLVEAVGLSQSALSQHLARLREDKVVSTRREGTSIYYRLSDPHIIKIIGLLYELYCADEYKKEPKSKKSQRDKD